MKRKVIGILCGIVALLIPIGAAAALLAENSVGTVYNDSPLYYNANETPVGQDTQQEKQTEYQSYTYDLSPSTRTFDIYGTIAAPDTLLPSTGKTAAIVLLVVGAVLTPISVMLLLRRKKHEE